MTNWHRARRLGAGILIVALACFGEPVLGQDATQKPAKAGEQPARPQQLAVRCLTFAPDGKSLAAAHGNNEGHGRLVLWDLGERKPRFVKEEDTIVPSVAYSPDGQLLALGSFTPVLRLLDPATGEVRREWKAHDQHVRSVAFSATGKHLATSSYDRTIKLWDPQSGELRRVLRGHQAPLRVIAISPDDRWLASAGGQEDIVRIWSLEREDEAPRELKFPGYVPQIAFSPDSGTLAIGCWVAGPILVDVKSGEEILRFTNMGGIHWVSFSPDGRWLAVATNGHDVHVFPARQSPSQDEHREIARLIDQFNDDDYATREAASRRLAELGGRAMPQVRAGVTSESAEVRVRCRRLLERMQSGEAATKLVGHTGELECLAFSADSTRLASGDWNGVIKLWDVSTWQEIATLNRDD